MGFVRIWLCAALAVCIWLLAEYAQFRPRPLGLDAPVTDFSAARADIALGRLLGPERPHPVGSAEDAAVHARLLQALTAMGVPARAQTAFSCFSKPRWGAAQCATVTNLIAQVLPGSGKPVLLMAHLDSVPAGPGACDDGCGVATLLETIRALKAQPADSGHPVMALFTDGEEAGLLGATAFLRDPATRGSIGAVINIEARGNRGPSYLFQTSPGDARLIDLYAGAVAHLATSSLYGEIYKILPNDTDLTPFLAAGITGYNFALVGDVAQYHTSLDTRAHIEAASLQQHGENALGLARALRQSDFASLKSDNAIYFDVLGLWLPRLPAGWALPLALFAFLLIALAGLLTPRDQRIASRPVTAALMPPLLLAGSVGLGFLLHGVAGWICGGSDPSFAFPAWLRWSLAFGVWAIALLAAQGLNVPRRFAEDKGALRRIEGQNSGIACWLWLAALAIATAAFVPGLSPYFLFPSLVAAPLLLLTVRHGRGLALMLAALVNLVVWLSLTAGGEAIMGLRLHPIFTLTAAFGLLAVLPLLAPVRGPDWLVSVCLSFAAAVALAVAAGFQPGISAAAPQRLNLDYLEQDGKAWWLVDPFWAKADTSLRLPAGLRAVAAFSAAPAQLAEPGFAAPAGAARFAPPVAQVTRQGDIVTLDLNAQGDGVAFVVPKSAGLRSFTLGGFTIPATSDRDFYIACVTPDCAHRRIGLRLGAPGPVRLLLEARRAGLPDGGARLLAARPADAVPSQGGDQTILAATVAVPGR